MGDCPSLRRDLSPMGHQPPPDPTDARLTSCRKNRASGTGARRHLRFGGLEWLWPGPCLGSGARISEAHGPGADEGRSSTRASAARVLGDVGSRLETSSAQGRLHFKANILVGVFDARDCEVAVQERGRLQSARHLDRCLQPCFDFRIFAADARDICDRGPHRVAFANLAAQ